jgi:hypothetical protein
MIGIVRTVIELLAVLTFSVGLAFYSSLGGSTSAGSGKWWPKVGLLVAVSLPFLYLALRVAISRLSRRGVGDKRRKG